MTTKEELMPVKYLGKWTVVVNKKEYVLTDAEVNILKKADNSGHRGIVWFDNFAISIPHISSIEKERVELKGDNERMLDKLHATGDKFITRTT